MQLNSRRLTTISGGSLCFLFDKPEYCNSLLVVAVKTLSSPLSYKHLKPNVNRIGESEAGAVSYLKPTANFLMLFQNLDVFICIVCVNTIASIPTKHDRSIDVSKQKW